MCPPPADRRVAQASPRRAALSYVATFGPRRWGSSRNFWQDRHPHTCFRRRDPKGGPSAGIAITTSLISACSSIPVRHDVAMTGRNHPARARAAHQRLRESFLPPAAPRWRP
ncbi:S16 family serine protease [Bilophila wadsworthia]|uniref:S16 family serine protease n=1 Tax=Bilophila wadsworthia TaxID=35833 RepID=UPI003C6BFD09